MTTYIWQHPDWPNWRYDMTRLAVPLADCDGTQWELKINYGNKRIKTYGDNAYPGTKTNQYSFKCCLVL
jgi:hypothetical protein